MRAFVWIVLVLALVAAAGFLGLLIAAERLDPPREEVRVELPDTFER
ncbi:MAG: hypothetical protein ACFB2Z_01550 [Maricaulaceae bacterium]